MNLNYNQVSKENNSLFTILWLKAFVLFFALFAGNTLNAQVSNLVNPTYGYTFLNTTTTYTALTGGTVFQSGASLNTDAVSAAITLPSVFTFNGIKENRIFISNNGFITFGIAPTAGQYSPISSTASSGYNGVISGFGVNAVQSTSAGSAGEIRYGTNGGGDFVIQFQDLGQSASTGVRMTFQIQLKADGKTVQIVYGPNNVGFTSASQVQVGLRGTNQQDWNNRTLASGGNWNTAGGAAGTIAQAMSCTATTTLPASGRTFQWSATAYAPTYLGTPFATTQDFTAWTNGSGPNNVPSTNWATNGFGNASWQIDNTTALTTTSGWTGTLGAYSPVDFASAVGGRSARFHTFNATSPQVGYLDYYVDLSGGLGALTVEFYSINPSGVDILQVFLSTDGGATFAQVGTNIGVSTTWTQRIISLGAVTSATSIIRFKATSDFGNDDIGIDNVKILQPPVTPPNCSASLVPANAATGIARNSTLTWSAATGSPTSYDVYFGTTTNPPLVTNTVGLSYTPPTMAATTQYFWKIVPKNGNGDAVGCTEQNFTTSAFLVYCTALPTSIDGNGITNVVLGSLSNPNVSTTRYQDFTGLTPPNLAQSSSISIAVTLATGFTYNVRAFIDFNQDGDFADAGENTLIGLSSNANPTTISGTIAVPLGATLGNTRMRIVATDNDTSNDPCWSSTFANVEDYTVNITLPPSCGTPTGLSASDIQITTADLSWVAPVTGTAASYDWEIRTTGAGGSGATGLVNFGNVLTTTVDNATGLAAGTSYNLYVRTNCTGGDGSSTWAGPFAFSTPVAGESCTTAATITVAPNLGAAVNTLLTTGLTSDGPNGTCSDGTGNPSKKDRWVSFVAPSSGNKVIVSTVSGTITDAVMQVWSACPATGVALGCSDDVVGLMPQLEFCSLTAGATYYVQIWPYSATATGNFSVRIYEDVACAFPPANDECAGVETIFVGAPGSCPGEATSGTTVAATATPGVTKTTCDAFGTYNDVFYKFNSGSNTELNFAFTNLTGTNEFGIYSGCGTTFLGVCSSSSLSTTLTGLTANTEYHIVVWANNAAAQGTFEICISALPPPNCVAAPTAPTNGGTVCAPSTTLSWPAVAGATSYDVYLDAGSGPATTLVSDNQTGTTYAATVTAGAYSWRIVPANSAGEATGCLDFTFTANSAPAGDTFATAIDLGTITASTSVNGNNQSSNCWNNDYTSASTPGNSQARASNDVFYKFEITECGSLMDIGTCTSSFDTYMHILDSTGVRINGDDDSCTTPNSSGSLVTTLALAPGVYYVVVEGFNAADMGTFTLDLTYVAGTPQVTYYQDLDADGFGNPAVSQMACTQPVGYVTNSTDCNDNNNLVYQSALLYTDVDGDGYNVGSAVTCYGATLPAGTSLTTLGSGDCNDTNAAIKPGATEVCYDGIDNDCDGTIDEGCTPIVSTVQPSQCGVTLPAINSFIYANLVSGAQGYRFRVTDMTTMQVQTIDKALRVFAITQLPSYAFNRTYQVEVSIRYANVWQPFYGLPCTVTTPATTTQVQSAQCSSTLTTMNDVIFADNVPFAAGYKFRITNLLTSEQLEFERPIRDIRLTNLPSPQFNTTYSIEVAVKNTNGSYLPYGTACNVTSPSFPTTQVQNSQCDLSTALPLTTTLFADSFTGATTYRFRFINGATTIQVDRPIRSIVLGSVPGIQSGTAYSVSVALEINGTFGPFGKVCLVTTAGGARETDVVKPVSPFNAMAYPNPFAENFKLNVTTSVEESIQVKVYDMLGKLVENRTVDTAVINEIEIGTNYPAGVYNVIVSQGSEVKTLRVIKR